MNYYLLIEYKEQGFVLEKKNITSSIGQKFLIVTMTLLTS